MCRRYVRGQRDKKTDKNTDRQTWSPQCFTSPYQGRSNNAGMWTVDSRTYSQDLCTMRMRFLSRISIAPSLSSGSVPRDTASRLALMLALVCSPWQYRRQSSNCSSTASRRRVVAAVPLRLYSVLAARPLGKSFVSRGLYPVT